MQTTRTNMRDELTEKLGADFGYTDLARTRVEKLINRVINATEHKVDVALTRSPS